MGMRGDYPIARRSNDPADLGFGGRSILVLAYSPELGSNPTSAVKKRPIVG